jgi:hypothetical protein
MNESTRPFSLANPSFLPGRTRVGHVDRIVPFRVRGTGAGLRKPSAPQASFLRPGSSEASLCISAPRMESSLPP